MKSYAADRHALDVADYLDPSYQSNFFHSKVH